MNTSQTYHDEQTGSTQDAPGPAVGHPARLLPSSRYRHPGDVIRLIAGGLLLIVALAAVALAPSQLVGTDASAVAWLGADPAGRLLVGLVQVAFVVAATAIVAIALWRRRFRLLVEPGGRRDGGRRRAGGDLEPGRRRASARGGGQPRARLVARQRGVPRPGAAGRCGGGHGGCLAVAEPPVAADGLDRAGRGGRGATGGRHRAADGADPRVRHRADRGSRRAGRPWRAGPADRTRRDRRGAEVRRPAGQLRHPGRRHGEGLPPVLRGHRGRAAPVHQGGRLGSA